eukprot:767091-Hanusia_phi.AAC.3
MIQGSQLLKKSLSSATRGRLLDPRWALGHGEEVSATLLLDKTRHARSSRRDELVAGWRLAVEFVCIQLPGRRKGCEPEGDARVTSGPRKVILTSEYLGVVSQQVALDVETSGDDDMRVLSGEGGRRQVLEFMLTWRECGMTSASELLNVVAQHPLVVDVWDGESKFSVGSIGIPLQGILQERHGSFVSPLISPFLPPLRDETRGAPLSQVAWSSTRQVQGWSTGGAVALRVLSSAVELKEDFHAIPPSPQGHPSAENNSGQGPGNGDHVVNGDVEGVKMEGSEERDLSLSQESKVFALMMCWKEKILDELRNFSNFRDNSDAMKSKRRWSEVELSAERFGLTVRALGLDDSHLQAALRSLKEGMTEGDGEKSDPPIFVDLQRLFYDRRYSLQLRMVGEQTVMELDDVDDVARAALARLCRELLFAMCGQGLHTYIPPQALFKRFATNGVLDLQGTENMLKFLQVELSAGAFTVYERQLVGGQSSSSGLILLRPVDQVRAGEVKQPDPRPLRHQELRGVGGLRFSV